MVTSRDSATLPNQVDTRCAKDKGVHTCRDNRERFVHGGNSGSSAFELAETGVGHTEASEYVSSKNFMVNQDRHGKAERNRRESRIASGLWKGPASVNFMALTKGNSDAYKSRDSVVNLAFGHSVPHTVSHSTFGKRERMSKGRLPEWVMLTTWWSTKDLT